ncbi:MAG: potassium channel family protein [Verrucomicrobiota bacterium]
MMEQARKPRKHAYFMLLCALMGMIFVLPILAEDDWGHSILGFLTIVTLVLSLRAVAFHRRTLIVAAILGVVGYAVGAAATIGQFDYIYALPFQLTFYVFINVSILKSVLRAKVIDDDVVCGGIAVYLLMGVNWAVVFAFIEMAQPGSIQISNGFDQNGVSTPVDFLYFSFVTLTTLGYGDIVPVSNSARIVAIMTALSGVLYVAVFIGRLVGLTIAEKGVEIIEEEEL